MTGEVPEGPRSPGARPARYPMPMPSATLSGFGTPGATLPGHLAPNGAAKVTLAMGNPGNVTLAGYQDGPRRGSAGEDSGAHGPPAPGRAG